MSAVSMTSLTPTGIPCSGPRRASASRSRLRERVPVQVRPRAQLAVALGDAVEAHLHELLRAHLPLGEQPDGLGRAGH